MRFAVWPNPQRPWDEVLALATWAEQAGLDGFWFADHFMVDTGTQDAGVGPIHECWAVLAAVGAAVPRLTLTSMVSPVTIHHPLVLTKRAATVDHITGGRAVLGLGAGWQINEHHIYGFELPAPGERVTRFERAIEYIHGLLRTDDTPFDPRPVSLPLLVGTGSPRMMRITARWADIWNVWGDPDVYAERLRDFNAACETVGRDPGSIQRSAQAMVFLVDDPARAEKLRQRAPAGRSLVGGPSELVDLLGTYVDAGVDEFAIGDSTLGESAEQRADTYGRLVAEVLSAFM